jgi:hypothetical protein
MRLTIGTAVCFVVLLPSLAARSQECAWSTSPPPNPAIRWRELAARADSLTSTAPSGRRRSVRVSEPRQQPANFIDVAAFARMTAAEVRWAPRSTDEEFLRRVSLDLTGRIPTAARAREFLEDGDPHKRQRLVDELLSSEEFVDRWSLWLGDVVQNVVSANMSYVGPERRNTFERKEVRRSPRRHFICSGRLSARRSAISSLPGVTSWPECSPRLEPS